ncbi:MAG: HAMP domain-containing sensor histidine kinase [Clostridia bacterium]|nr:HAMP domain-containing sensor histidine kinase [Clostridia bacterium]
MFTRIMSMVLAVILLLTAALTITNAISVRNREINNKLAYLTGQASDIAYIAGQMSSDSRGIFTGSFYQNDSQTTKRYLNKKASDVYEEFGAYIAVVDRQGNVQDNIRAAYSEDPDFAASLSGQEIRAALNRILGGETISVRTYIDGDPVFTVGVPYMRSGTVRGAVFIQTKAQRVEAGLTEMMLRSAAIALAALLLAGICLFFYVRSVLKPLKALTEAAASMADGDFKVRLNESGSTQEIRELSGAFNIMAGKLSEVETGRREFVANVSHELKSPITSIRGFAEGMADGVIPPEEQPKYLGLMSDEAKRLSTLIEDLLALSRLEREDAAPDYCDFDINEMLRRAIIRRINDLDEKQLDVVCEFEADECFVHADNDRIEQVIINLFDNAIKFTPSNGRIVLKTERLDDCCTVTVTDNGIGIPEEDRGKVFDRFFTADRAHTAGKGTGLGLSICKRIMEMHRRTIRLLDTETGASFMITLDKAEQQRKTEADENA